jgi:CRP-like cAMP-binding protein
VFARAATDPTFASIAGATPIERFDDIHAALEWCEERLLASLHSGVERGSLREQPLLRGLDAEALAAIEDRVEVALHSAGDLVVHEGDPADAIYFVLAGTVRVQLSLPDGSARRVASFAPGMSFGESALLDKGVRTADVVVEDDAEIAVLTLAALQELMTSIPSVSTDLYRNHAQMLAARLASANVQLRALD